MIDLYYWNKSGFRGKVYRIVDFDPKHDFSEDKMYALCEVVSEIDPLTEEWVPDLPEFLVPAVEAGMKKCTCYHCRCTHYGRRKEG